MRDALFARDDAAAEANEVAPVAAAAAAGRHGQTVAVEAVTDDPVAAACHSDRPFQPTATDQASPHGCAMMTSCKPSNLMSTLKLQNLLQDLCI